MNLDLTSKQKYDSQIIVRFLPHNPGLTFLPRPLVWAYILSLYLSMCLAIKDLLHSRVLHQQVLPP